MSLVLSRYQAFQRSEDLLRETEKLCEALTGFSGKSPNVPLTVLQIQIVFAGSPIKAPKRNMPVFFVVSQNIINELLARGGRGL